MAQIAHSFIFQIYNAVKVIRIHHWVKNFFVMAPVFFSGQFFQEDKLINSVLAFIGFSFAASSIYIINDIFDIEFDKLHPKKKFRPIASGALPKSNAFILFFTLITAAISFAFFIDTNFCYVIISYIFLNILYSQKLKNFPIIDITCIAIGFVLRVIGGGIAANIFVSKWLVIMTFLLSLFLAFSKRRDDIFIEEDEGKKMRKAINGYNYTFINLSMILMAAVLIVCYFMYLNSPEIVNRFSNPYLYLSGLFVVTGVLRYLQITFVEENSGSPTKILLKDTFTQLNLLGWVIFFFYLLYL